jgi:hypothetical protein
MLEIDSLFGALLLGHLLLVYASVKGPAAAARSRGVFHSIVSHLYHYPCLQHGQEVTLRPFPEFLLKRFG